eukprot:12691854-Alexandrium_andersonii.AAC.1
MTRGRRWQSGRDQRRNQRTGKTPPRPLTTASPRATRTWGRRRSWVSPGQYRTYSPESRRTWSDERARGTSRPVATPRSSRGNQGMDLRQRKRPRYQRARAATS